MTFTQKRILFASPALFALLLGALLLTTRIEEKNLRGVITDLESAGAEDILQAVIDHELTDASTPEDMVADLTFDQVFTSMTLDELLSTLLAKGWITGYQDLPSLRQGLIERELTGFATELDAFNEEPLRSIDMLRPDGILTALATTKSGAILQGGALASALEWERATLAKDMLRSDFEADRFAFLDFLEPLHLLELLAGGSTTSATDPTRSIALYSWNNEVVPEESTHIFPTIILNRPPHIMGDPAHIKALTDAQPEGHRALRLWSIMFPTTPVGANDALTDPLTDEEGNPLVFQDMNGDPYLVPALTMEKWKEIVSQDLDTFMSSYKAIGGTVDKIILDVEYTWIAQQNEQRMALLMQDPQWPIFAEMFAEVGLTDFSNIVSWNAWRDYRLTRWNAVIHRIQTQYLTDVVYRTIARHFPDVTFSNYWNAQTNQTVPNTNYLHFKNSYHGIGAIAGTHQSDSTYGLGNDGITWIPDSQPDGRGQKAFDEPTPPVGAQVKEIQGTGGIVTVSMHQPLPGVEVGDIVQLRMFRCAAGVFSQPQHLYGIDAYTDEYEGTYEVLTIEPNPQDPATKIITVALPGDHPFMGFHPRRCQLYVLANDYYDVLAHNIAMMRSIVSTSSVPSQPWVWYVGEAHTRSGWRDPDHMYADQVFHIGLHNPDAIFYWNSLLPCTYCTANSHCLYGSSCDTQTQMCVEPGHSDCAVGILYTDHIMRELSAIAGYENARELVRTAAFYDDPYMLSGIDAGGRKVWRLTPDPKRSITVLSASPARFDIDGEIVEFPHSEIYAYPRELESPFYDGPEPGYWIIQTKPRDMLTTTPGAALRIITGRPVEDIEIAGTSSTDITVKAGETKTVLLAGIDPENPPRGRSIVTLPIKLQGLAHPQEFLSFAHVFTYPYNIGVAQGEIEVMQLSPDSSDIGSYAFTLVTENGDPMEVTVTVEE